MSERIDISLVRQGFAKSREKAKAMINGGSVFADGECIHKSSFLVTDDTKIEIRGEILPYVGRGGYKLAKALDVFKIDLRGKTAIDMGASTGGFTDCMLKNGAAKVYAVDVGKGQLSQELSTDPRVINMESTNIREMKKNDINDEIDFISIDTSFISLKYILPAAFMYIKEDGKIVALIKPQFEAGRGNIGKNGIVKDKKIHFSVIEGIYNFVTENGFTPAGITVSPIKGGDGNVEYLILIDRSQKPFDVKYIRNIAGEKT
ncbi:MAG: TlyA family RNA methyltransferase [Bacillota bacterium]|nr:TlyA family RNA methyltransferase [Bacillota bacterium]